MRSLLYSLGIGVALIASNAAAADLDAADAVAVDLGVPDPDAAEFDVIVAPDIDALGGAYVAARIAGAFTEDTDFDITDVNTNIANQYNVIGIGGAVAAGYEFTWGSNVSLRGEVEGGVVQQHVQSHQLGAIGTTLSDPLAFGTTETIYGLVNAAMDYHVGNGFKPFLGGGIGYAKVDFQNHGVTLAAPVGTLGPGSVTVMDDTASGFVWQVGGGVGYQLDWRTTLEAGYRYFQVNDVELVALDGTTSDVLIKQHQLQLGMRYGF